MKNRILKAVLSFSLAIVMLFTIMPIASAQSVENSDDIIATVTLFCRPQKLIHGHGWIYVENLSDSTLKVGHYDLPPGEGVSIGTFANSREDGWGVYYNIESYCAATYGLSGSTTLTEELTASEFETLSKNIHDYLNTWNHLANCIFFAFSTWNSVSDKKFIPVLFPIFAKLQMKFYDCQTDTPEMMPVTADRVYRQKNTGDQAYLVPVSEGSLGPM